MRIFATSYETAAATAEKLQATMTEEIEVGKRLYRDGIIVQAYMDPAYERTFMILEAPSIDVAREAFAAYPQVREGLIAFDFIPLIGMPAVAGFHAEQGTALPTWWPNSDSSPG